MPAYCKDSCELKNYRFEQQVLDDKKYASDLMATVRLFCNVFLQKSIRCCTILDFKFFAFRKILLRTYFFTFEHTSDCTESLVLKEALIRSHLLEAQWLLCASWQDLYRPDQAQNIVY